MIVFDLHCGDSGETFEAWFRSNADFEQQRAAGLVQCPFCGSTRVAKAPMAPSLPRKSADRGLAKVAVPVRIWSGAIDNNVPTASNAGPVQAALGAKADLRVVTGAGHFSFLVPCGLIGPPLLCRDAKGFDRKLFHESFNQEIVRFFQTKLN